MFLKYVCTASKPNRDDYDLTRLFETEMEAKDRQATIHNALFSRKKQLLGEVGLVFRRNNG